MGLRGVAGWLVLAVAAGRAASEGVGALEEAVPRGARRQLVAGEARRRCVFHLHVPKCAGTFVWRFLKGRFCEDEARICGRETLLAPPACDCVVNPITRDGGVLAAIRGGGYAFTSAHSRSAFQASTACALAVWFREPVSRVRSHYGYFKHKRKTNATALADVYRKSRVPAWVSNQQWALLMPRARVTGPGAPTVKDVAAATQEVAALAFVGVVEDMDASLCIFATSYLPRHKADLCAADSRAKKENVAVGAKAPPDAKEQDLIRKFNKYDARLYDVARAEFARRKADHAARRRP